MARRPDGLIIRPPRLEDASDLHELCTLPGVMWGTMQVPSLTLEQARRRLEERAADRSSYAFVAELDGKVVGSAGLHVGDRKARHTGDIGVMVHDSHVGRGIGRALMEALLDIADNYLGLKRVELEVYTDNDAAIRLYESLGFQREGVKRCAIYRAGRFDDLLVMGRVRE